MWFGYLFLVCGLVGFGVGITDWFRYRRGPLPDPALRVTSVLGFLGSAMCLVAAIVSFFA
jgi:hypothetical protein